MSSSKFMNAFNPASEEHVQWMKSLFDVLDIMKLNSDDIIKQEKALQQYDINNIMKSNPFNINITDKDLLEYPIIHFSLAMKYSEAVLKNNAWIPSGIKK